MNRVTLVAVTTVDWQRVNLATFHGLGWSPSTILDDGNYMPGDAWQQVMKNFNTKAKVVSGYFVSFVCSLDYIEAGVVNNSHCRVTCLQPNLTATFKLYMISGDIADFIELARALDKRNFSELNQQFLDALRPVCPGILKAAGLD